MPRSNLPPPRAGKRRHHRKKLIDDIVQKHGKRNAAKYDGIVGIPPSWVPTVELGRFFDARNTVLDYYRDDLTTAREVFQRYEAVSKGMISGKRSRYHIPPQLIKPFALLFKIQTAVSAGKRDGIALLIGADATTALLAISAAERGQKGGKTTGKKKQSDVAKKHHSIAEQAKKLLETGKGKRDLAGILAQRHPLSKTHIRRILQKQGILQKRVFKKNKRT